MHPKHFAPYQSASDFPSKKRKGFEKALKEIEMDRYILISCLFLDQEPVPKRCFTLVLLLVQKNSFN
jgi:hypothetical protein